MKGRDKKKGAKNLEIQGMLNTTTPSASTKLLQKGSSKRQL